ncbi:hypothetical protein Droror1_Dr00027300 [Drosera rotundifolia]
MENGLRLFCKGEMVMFVEFEVDSCRVKAWKFEASVGARQRKRSIFEFTSDLEIAEFEGARVRTIGIRGQVKKVAKEEIANVPRKKGGVLGEGIFRCTFEDKILMSDIVFLRAWTQVEVPAFYNPLMTALQPREQAWHGMKTVAELRREHNIPTLPILQVHNFTTLPRLALSTYEAFCSQFCKF